MMSSMTNTFEFGNAVIMRRMSFDVATTVCTRKFVSFSTSSIKNRFDGSDSANVNTLRTMNSGITKLFSMKSRGRMSAVF